MSILDPNFAEESLDRSLEKIVEHETVLDELTLKIYRLITSQPTPKDVMFSVVTYIRMHDDPTHSWNEWMKFRKKISFASWQSMSDVYTTLNSAFSVRNLWVVQEETPVLVDIPQIEYIV